MAKFRLLIPTILMLIFEAAVGVLLLIDGEKFTQIIFIIFGVFLLVVGLVKLIRSLLAGRNGGSISMSQMFFSVILIAAGAFFAAASGSVLSVVSAFTLVIGIIMAFIGMLKLMEYAAIRKYSAVTWVAVISAIITIILGIVIAFNPFGATEVLWVILGVMLIVSAVLDLISLIIFGIALKNVPKSAVINVEVKEIED